VLTNYELFVEILRADKITKIAPDLFANLISSKQENAAIIRTQTYSTFYDHTTNPGEIKDDHLLIFV
jgi:hypothetical protein